MRLSLLSSVLDDSSKRCRAVCVDALLSDAPRGWRRADGERRAASTACLVLPLVLACRPAAVGFPMSVVASGLFLRGRAQHSWQRGREEASLMLPAKQHGQGPLSEQRRPRGKSALPTPEAKLILKHPQTLESFWVKARARA